VTGSTVATLAPASLPTLDAWGDLARARAALAGGAGRLRLEGLWGSAASLALAALLPPGRPAVVAVADEPTALRTLDDLRAFAAALGRKTPGEIVVMPVPHAALWRDTGAREEDAGRAGILGRLLRGEPLWVIVPARGLEAALPGPAAFRRQVLTLAPGDSVDRDALIDHLQAAGYERVESVTGVGQWALRGGIVDVFSPAGSLPVRVELTGDEVDSLRSFDPTSQRSTGSVATLLILPMLAGDTEAGARLGDYLPADAPLAVADPALLAPGAPDAPALEALGARPRVECGVLLTDEPGAFRLETRSIEGVRGQLRRLEPALAAWRGEGFRVCLLAPDPRTADRLQEILRDLEHEVPVVAALLGPEPLAVLVAGAHVGFECPGLGLVCLTETELFGHRRTMRRRPTYQRGAAIAAFTDLAPGDLVVHVEHGIGRYTGLVNMAVDGQPADYLLLEYAEGAKLYLPVQRMAAVTKYTGSGNEAPRLDKLGATTWQRTKESVRASLREMATELLRLYAERQVVEGLAIAPDTPWQHEFEAAFPFEETPDQLETIRQVKADLERRQPMDRLVCGDVGYGKTEVAMRAALKVALDGHQVAVLVPTTILAEQHWNTFRERFAPYPVRVDMLSRFRSPAQQKAVLAGLAAGTIDVVIGTHRLLSKDVAFKNLGLLVVDEEHRFGVAHKERLKQLRKSVHVLTLTATPIPRTLSMAMAGIRDLSVIESPPADRLAVETVVARFDARVIKEAIERELGRGGQVFVVHNRIQSLPALVRLIQRLVPRARVAMAHGQLREATLERTMLDYVEGAYDVLVATAIIESGLDIPASNTIIINRADRLGLAQLYQLRGRVGRDRLQAYAYLLIPADGRVDETAAKRLRVIQELTALGSGLKVALRDMEIRGAGNLLGAQQHGQIEMVGFDLYLKLLEEAVRELRGEAVEEDIDPVVTVDAAAYLPDEYVAEPAQRLALYKRLAGIRTAAEVDDGRRELRDRFGPLPEAAARLLDVVTLRLEAKALRLERLEVRSGHALLTFAPSTPVPAQRIVDLLRLHGRRLRTVREFVLEATVPRGPWPETLKALTRLLAEFRGPTEARR
jgi:transcription-repair coupling factor (superfamily II helicase)